MTADTSVPHVLTAPHQPAFSGCWYGWCSCGEEFSAGTAQAVRDAGLPHRLVEIARLRAAGTLHVDRDRDDERRLRRESRREQWRSKVEGGRKK